MIIRVFLNTVMAQILKFPWIWPYYIKIWFSDGFKILPTGRLHDYMHVQTIQLRCRAAYKIENPSKLVPLVVCVWELPTHETLGIHFYQEKITEENMDEMLNNLSEFSVSVAAYQVAIIWPTTV